MNPILKSYFVIADTIAGTFGEQCEVVVHDLSRPESSVVHVANGAVTGRQDVYKRQTYRRRGFLPALRR